MYTLEEDGETPSRLQKQGKAGNTSPDPEEETSPRTAVQVPFDSDFTSQSTGRNGLTTPNSGKAERAPHEAKSQHHDISQQITASMRALTTPEAATAGMRKQAVAALTVACISVFITALDQTVVVTALPQIITDLQIPITQIDHAAWIISAYLLGFVVAMPLMGRVSDIYGRRRIFHLCLVIFGLGSLFCALAPSLGQSVDLSFLSALHVDTSSPGLVLLIAARFFQAIGGGAIVPVSMAIASDFYGRKRRALALGIIGAMTEAGGALGPLYGALIVAQFGWQYIFYFNVPLVVILIIAAWKLIPLGKRLHEGIDWLGALLLGLVLTCLSLGLAQQGTTLGPTSPNQPTPQNNPLALALAVVFLIAFVLVERKVRWPVVELSLFKRFTFTATALVSLLVGAALIIAMADIPIFVDTVLQRPVLDSGLALLRLTAMIPIGALLGGWLCSRITCRLTAVLGLLFTAVGFYLMSLWPIDVNWTQITVSTITAGFGFGLVISPIGTTAINTVKAKQAGMSSAVVTALRMVGMTLGLATLTSWALAYFKDLAAQYPRLPANPSVAQYAKWALGYAAHLVQAAHTVYTSVFFFSMIICLIAIVPALFLWGKKAPPADPEADMHDVEPLPNGTDLLDSRGAVHKPANPSMRRRIIIIACIAAVIVLSGGGVAAAWMLNNPAATTSSIGSTSSSSPVAGPRMIQLALDKDALTSLLSSQLSAQKGVLTDLNATPKPDNGLVLTLNLHIDANGIHRTMPIELDGSIGVDKQQNLQLHLTHLRRDGLDAGPTATTNMQSALNSMLNSSVITPLRGQGVKLLSAQTTTTMTCGKGSEMLVLLIQAPPMQGVAAQPTPTPFCLTGKIDPQKLLPH